MDQPVEVVKALLYDIDGIKVYNVKADSRLQLLEAIKDVQKWKRDSRTDWAGYSSVQYKDCSGGFTWPNTKCLYFQQYKYRNRVSFKNNGICKYCSASGNHLPYVAGKYVAYSSDKMATIYHIGDHTCFPRDIHKRLPDVVKSALSVSSAIKPSEIESMAILSELKSRKNWKVVEKTAKKVASFKTISNEKTKQKSEIQPNGEGFAAVSELKSYTDLQDPLLIYAVNGNEQYVFKTSTAQMKIALEMDEEGDHFMHNEYCHFDGNHKRVKTFVTLTASVYHLLLKKQIVLATMNCKHKDSNYVAKFWRTFNEAFKKANGTEKRFSPTGWLSDMASASFNRLSTIYGKDVVEKVKS